MKIVLFRAKQRGTVMRRKLVLLMAGDVSINTSVSDYDNEESRVRYMKKKIISLIIVLALCLPTLPVGAIASATGLCEHHTEHIDCGYIEGEFPCGYSCAECAAAAAPVQLSGEQLIEPEADQPAELETRQPIDPACTCETGGG